MKPSPFYRRPLQLSASPQRPSSIIHPPSAFWTIVLSHLILLVALGLSLRWNVLQAREHSLALDRAYLSGHTAGIRWAESVLLDALAAGEPPEEKPGDDKL